MPRIKIEVKENIATNLTPEIEIVSNNGDYEIEFSFDALWDSSSVKTARFYYNFSHTDIVFDGNVCQVPPLYETQLLKVGVFTDTNKTTTDAEIKCRFSIKKYGGNVHEPTEDVYAQIIELLNKYIEQGGSGGISQEQVEEIIKEYFDKNPIQVDLSTYQTKEDERLDGLGENDIVQAILAVEGFANGAVIEVGNINDRLNALDESLGDINTALETILGV